MCETRLRGVLLLIDAHTKSRHFLPIAVTFMAKYDLSLAVKSLWDRIGLLSTCLMQGLNALRNKA